MTNLEDIAKKGKAASIKAMLLSSELKNKVLEKIAENLETSKDFIIKANQKDLSQAQKMLENNEITKSAFNRLKLDENKLKDMVQGVLDITKLEDLVNKTLWKKELSDGIELHKVACPIGLIGVIFEARPDVISQISALAIKSSNAVVLKGGSEAKNTNTAIFEVITDTLKTFPEFPSDFISLVYTREDVSQMLKLDKYFDLIIPRGSNSLVRYIKENTKIAVLGHSDGICHIYIDETADINKVLKICVDAKCQYPSACNSVETILINKNVLSSVLPKLSEELKNNGVLVKGDEKTREVVPSLEIADETDWKTEYGEKIVSIKCVDYLDEAIEHINTYGSHHTDSIITENKENAEKFMLLVDSAGVYHNISTRFADGFRYGFGAEVGISTNKTHARGPVGIDGLMIYKYKLYGSGDIVSDFTTHKRAFTHKFLD